MVHAEGRGAFVQRSYEWVWYRSPTPVDTTNAGAAELWTAAMVGLSARPQEGNVVLQLRGQACNAQQLVSRLTQNSEATSCLEQKHSQLSGETAAARGSSSNVTSAKQTALERCA